MKANFSSWLQFKNNFDFINQSHNIMLKQILKENNFDLIKDNLILPDESIHYSYLISEYNPQIQHPSLILNSLSRIVYLKYEYAINNLVSYIPEENLNLNDIKGFSIMDYIIVPSLEVKKYIEKRVPNIDKVFFIPFPIKEIKNTSNSEKVILVVNSENLKNQLVQQYLKLDNLIIYTNETDLLKILFPEKNILNRDLLYFAMEKNIIIIDFYNDFLSSIIQKKALINSIPYYGIKNIFSHIEVLNADFLSHKQLNTKANEPIKSYSENLKLMFSEENCKKELTNLFDKIINNHKKVSFYLNQADKKVLSYQKQVEKIISQIHKTKTYIYLDQELNNLDSIKISEKINQLINQFDYLIIVEKSRIINLLDALKNFNVIGQFNFGSSELKLSEKEMQMIIISKENIDDEKIYVKWEGYQFFHISLAVINRELEIKLIKNDGYELSIISQDYYSEIGSEYEYFNDLNYCINKPLLKKADFYIRHILPSGLIAPDKGKYILIFPWEAGFIPGDLVNHINQEVDELWCPSEYIKSLHINSGVFKRKIQVIPNGIDLKVFKPLEKSALIQTKKKFKFLFVGGILFRKGLDLLIEAYLSEFNINDDVSLILKGLGQNTYYNSPILAELLKNNNDKRAEIIFIDENLNSENLAKLYSDCDVYVHPYRAEGFGMPIFESMACGTVPIVTNYGPSLEYCNESNSFLVDYFPKENIEQQTFIEPDIIHLKKLMRQAYENPEIVKIKSENAVKAVQGLSWDNIFNKVDCRLKLLKRLPEYRNTPNFYINYLSSKISNDNDNTDLLGELKMICKKDIYGEIMANERFIKNDYKTALSLYMALFKINKNKEYSEKIYQLLLLLGDKITAEKIKNIMLNSYF